MGLGEEGVEVGRECGRGWWTGGERLGGEGEDVGGERGEDLGG